MGEGKVFVIGLRQCGGNWGNISVGQRVELPYHIAADIVGAGFARLERSGPAEDQSNHGQLERAVIRPPTHRVQKGKKG